FVRDQVEQRAQALAGVGDRFELAEHFFLFDFLPALQRGHEQGIARREVPVEAALRYAKAAREGFDRHGGHALFGDEVECRLAPVVRAEAATAFRTGRCGRGHGRHQGGDCSNRTPPTGNVLTPGTAYRCAGGRRVDAAPRYYHTRPYVGRRHRRAVHRLPITLSPSSHPCRSAKMSIAVPFLVFLLVGAFSAYHRLRLPVWAALTAVALVACWLLGANGVATAVAGIIAALIAVPLLLPQIRLPFISTPLLGFYTRILPPLSETERSAIEAGTVGFEGELFSGRPDWQVLLDQPAPTLTADEQAFLDGPVEELCRMTDDWDITHVRADLPPEMWEFIKKNRFFGMIVPKEYGGLGFSALGNHKVIQKLASISSVVSSTVGVPNSLGPAELLMHYGTQEQKDHYLPRLADGREVPCFALTGPWAGSDATSIPDFGVVCMGDWNGANVVG